MTTYPFNAPVADILRSLNMAARDLPGWDAETSTEIVSHFADFAQGVIAPLDEVGDRQGCRLENGRLRLPDGFAEAFSQLAGAGWQGLCLPE